MVPLSKESFRATFSWSTLDALGFGNSFASCINTVLTCLKINNYLTSPFNGEIFHRGCSLTGLLCVLSNLYYTR